MLSPPVPTETDRHSELWDPALVEPVCFGSETAPDILAELTLLVEHGHKQSALAGLHTRPNAHLITKRE